MLTGCCFLLPLLLHRLPARLRRKSVNGSNGETLSKAEQEPASVGRMKALIKTTTAPVVAVKTVDPLGKAREPATDTFEARKRVLIGGASVNPAFHRERSAPAVAFSSQKGSAQSRARFMAPTASSRMAAAQKQTPGDAQQRSTKAKTAARRPASSSSGKGNSDLHDLQELLAKHNKKFKSTHTYQPPQHSVRDVRVVRFA